MNGPVEFFLEICGESGCFGNFVEVFVQEGVFNAVLEGVQPSDFSGPEAFLTVCLETPFLLRSECFRPDQKFASVPYAMRCQEAAYAGYAATALSVEGLPQLVGEAVQNAIPDVDPAALQEVTTHITDTGNPHQVTADQVGAPSATAFGQHADDPAVHHTRYADAEAVGAILVADGPDSGLDADLLDGRDSADFALVDPDTGCVVCALTADSATTADFADEAGNAMTADSAATADFADVAGVANSVDLGLNEYEISAVDDEENTVATAVHQFCALAAQEFQDVGDPNVAYGCEVIAPESTPAKWLLRAFVRGKGAVLCKTNCI